MSDTDAHKPLIEARGWQYTGLDSAIFDYLRVKLTGYRNKLLTRD